jgi:hypothetical protein
MVTEVTTAAAGGTELPRADVIRLAIYNSTQAILLQPFAVNKEAIENSTHPFVCTSGDPLTTGRELPASDQRAAREHPAAPTGCRAALEEELAALREGLEASASVSRAPALKLGRHVRGTAFFHKGKLPAALDIVHRLTIEKREGGEGTRSHR